MTRLNQISLFSFDFNVHRNKILMFACIYVKVGLMIKHQTFKNKLLIWILLELFEQQHQPEYKNLFCGSQDLFVGGYENQYHHDFA